MSTNIDEEGLSSKVKFEWLLIEVMDEHIIAVKSFDGKVVSTYISRTDYPTPIEEVFYMINLQTEFAYEKLYVVYDKEFGFPRFYLDTAEKGPGGIFRFEIVEFENLDNEP